MPRRERGKGDGGGRRDGWLEPKVREESTKAKYILSFGKDKDKSSFLLLLSSFFLVVSYNLFTNGKSLYSTA